MEQAVHHFQLQPFPGGPEQKAQKISGSLFRSVDTLLIEYKLEGGLDSVNWPDLVPLPCRCHGLWHNTCFEFFIGIQDEPGYLEVNYSPDGCWNVYRFSGYREKMREEDAVTRLCSSNSQGSSCWNVSCLLELSGIIGSNCRLEIGVSVVVRHHSGDLNYWALCHPGLKADFHNRACFTIKIPAVAG